MTLQSSSDVNDPSSFSFQPDGASTFVFNKSFKSGIDSSDIGKNLYLELESTSIPAFLSSSSDKRALKTSALLLFIEYIPSGILESPVTSTKPELASFTAQLPE